MDEKQEILNALNMLGQTRGEKGFTDKEAEILTKTVLEMQIYRGLLYLMKTGDVEIDIQNGEVVYSAKRK